MMMIDVDVKKSEIHGLGIFARTDIPGGAVLWMYTPGLDHRISGYAVKFAEPRKRDFIMERGYQHADRPDWIICADEAQFWNFPIPGQESNCSLGGEQDGENIIVAARPIMAGEELTICPESDGDYKRKMEARYGT